MTRWDGRGRRVLAAGALLGGVLAIPGLPGSALGQGAPVEGTRQDDRRDSLQDLLKERARELPESSGTGTGRRDRGWLWDPPAVGSGPPAGGPSAPPFLFDVPRWAPFQWTWDGQTWTWQPGYGR
jgi:hypothetical protein